MEDEGCTAFGCTRAPTYAGSLYVEGGAHKHRVKVRYCEKHARIMPGTWARHNRGASQARLQWELVPIP